MRTVNVKSFYGDASRPDLLHTAGIEDASLVVVAIDDTARAIEMVKHIKLTHSHVQVLARAFDRGHVFELKEAGADYVISETYNSALIMAGEALIRMGIEPAKAEKLKEKFTAVEEKHFDTLFHSWRNEGESFGFDEHFLKLFMKIEAELIKTMQRDCDEKSKEVD
jgi:CPA2 family monovalent cation:H+ antiporter-2/glutathione-regulated potassium-efflux system ancillary protein KefC